MISIVIPTHNHCNDLLQPCIESIIQYTDLNNVEVIIVANGCTDNTKQYLEGLPKEFKTIWFDEGIGYTKASNEGIKKSSNEFILLLNNDIVLLPQEKNTWVNMLLEPFMRDPQTGITGPVKFYWNCAGTNRNCMAFWCVMFKKSLTKEIGFLDEIFNPGMGEDGDFSVKAEMAGFKLVQVPNDTISEFGKGIQDSSFPIFHHGNGTFIDLNKDEIIQRNAAILDERYKNSLESTYTYCCSHPCDINQLFPLLREYASQSLDIVEMGVRGVFTTYAFLAAKPRRLVSYDIDTSPNIGYAYQLAQEHGITFEFRQEDVLQATIEETDLLFIDTRHTYNQLKSELERHAGKVRRHILIHDTTSFGEIGEDGEEGMCRAISEFVEKNKEWYIASFLNYSNGMTILQRKNMKKPEVSIVIPTYNHCDDLLKPCLESLIRYTDLSKTEVIVVANGCTDKTKQYVKSLGKPFKLIWEEEKLGYTKSTNIGIKAAKGEYIVLLNNDTILLPHGKNVWIDKLKAPFLNDNSVGLTGPLELYDNYAGDTSIIFFCVMIKKEVFEKVGCLDEIFSPGGGEDIDFTIRCKQNGYKAVVSNDMLSQNVGDFPIYHKAEGTFSVQEHPEYGNFIIKRNGLINLKRFNKHIRLNLGSGGVEVPGYLSLDKKDNRALILMDACHLDFDDNSVEELLASHLIEHINPFFVFDLLKEWYRVLKPGGRLIMEMPDILEVCKNFEKANKMERYGLLNVIYGSVNTTAEGIPSDITAPHMYGWYPEAMFDHLAWAGYTNIVFEPTQFPHPGYNFRVVCQKPEAT